MVSFGNAKVVELFQQLPYHVVMLCHTVGIEPDAPIRGFLEMGPDMHAGAVEPHEERLLVFRRLVDKARGVLVDLLVNGRHAGHVERTGIFDFLSALAVGVAAPMWLPFSVVHPPRHTPRRPSDPLA
jgi:hypothetical protein